MRKSVIISLLLLSALFLGNNLKPKLKPIDLAEQPDFERIIPKEFADWRVVDDVPVIIADPQMQQNIDKLYAQTVNRSYVNTNESVIMLSLAYGLDQRDSMQVHKPEVCYPAQGFVVNKEWNQFFDTGYGTIPIKFLDTNLSNRREYVTYWILLGDEVVSGGFDKKMKQLSYSLLGKVPDGLLFRVSSIGSVEQKELSIQREFIKELLSQIKPNERRLFIGTEFPIKEGEL
jgi:EpsI family protein